VNAHFRPPPPPPRRPVRPQEAAIVREFAHALRTLREDELQRCRDVLELQKTFLTDLNEMLREVTILFAAPIDYDEK
jgi:hypothetical protein